MLGTMRNFDAGTDVAVASINCNNYLQTNLSWLLTVIFHFVELTQNNNAGFICRVS